MVSLMARGRDYHHRRHHLYFALLIITLLSLVSCSAAEVGYGPGFDACGDNCQTALRIFCTENRDAGQQSDCWCGVGELETAYEARLEACLATCDPAVFDVALQRNVMGRYKAVVCAGNARGDPEFADYYSARYLGSFIPDATKAAPPPAVAAMSAVLPPSTKTKTITKTIRPSGVRSATSRSLTKTSSLSVSSRSADSSTTSTRSASATLSSSLRPSSTARTSSTASTLSTRTRTQATTGPSKTSTPEPSASSAEAAPKDDLSAGAITGISIASIIAFTTILLVFAVFLRRRRRRSMQLKELAESPPVTPPVRRVSVYYSPDDVGTSVAARGAWINGDAHPGVRVPSLSPTVIDSESGDDCSSTSSSSSSDSGSLHSSEWSYYGEAEGFYDIDLGEYGSSYDAEAARAGGARGYGDGRGHGGRPAYGRQFEETGDRARRGAGNSGTERGYY